MPLADYRDKKSWINRLSPEQRNLIIDNMWDITYDECNFVYHEATTPKGIHFIKEGMVKLSSVDTCGAERILGYFGKGMSFGETAAFSGLKHRCSAIARSRVRTGFLPRAKLISITSQHTDIAQLLLEHIAWRHSKALEMSLQRERLGLAERLATTLLNLLRVKSIEEEAINGRTEYLLPLTQNEVACVLGSTRQTINKIMGSWCAQEIIRLEYGQIKIISLEKLEAYANQQTEVIEPIVRKHP